MSFDWVVHRFSTDCTCSSRPCDSPVSCLDCGRCVHVLCELSYFFSSMDCSLWDRSRRVRNGKRGWVQYTYYDMQSFLMSWSTAGREIESEVGCHLLFSSFYSLTSLLLLRPAAVTELVKSSLAKLAWFHDPTWPLANILKTANNSVYVLVLYPVQNTCIK